MTPSDFLHLFESVLRQRRVPFSRAAAIAFVESCWELIDDNPDAWYWSEQFVEAASGEVQEFMEHTPFVIEEASLPPEKR